MNTVWIAVFSMTLLGCCGKPAYSEGQDQSEKILFTDVDGPSEASGDCGGFAFWLQASGEKFSAGEFAEFEDKLPRN